VLSDPTRGHDLKDIYSFLGLQWKRILSPAVCFRFCVIGGAIVYFAHGCRMINTEVTSVLRGNPLQVRVISEQKLCIKIIYIVLQTSVRLFIIEVQIKHLKVLG